LLKRCFRLIERARVNIFWGVLSHIALNVRQILGH
jgi:hypothetical protein